MHNLGATYLQQGQYAKARVEIKRVLQIKADFAQGYYMLGMIELQLRNREDAFKWFQKALRVEPGHVASLLETGRYYFAAGDFKGVMEQTDKVLKIEPEN